MAKIRWSFTEERMALGLCTKCGCAKEDIAKRQCNACRLKSRLNQYERNKKYKEKRMNHTVKIKYFSDEIPRIKEFDKGDWIDLCASEDVEMKKGEYKCIKLGVAMQLPEGYTAYVLPRSSTYKNFKILLVNGCGVIDNSYCGDNDEWGFPALATEDTIIRKGDRICQFSIQKSPDKFYFSEVAMLGNRDRGGFGSTGV